LICAAFFADRADEYGGGDTPQAAYDDLVRRIDLRALRDPDSPGPEPASE
jgi:hypothetical protein